MKVTQRFLLFTKGVGEAQTFFVKEAKIVHNCSFAKGPSELTFTPVEDFIKALPDGCWCQA